MLAQSQFTLTMPMRNIVERFFCKMKYMRMRANFSEKHAINFHNMIYIFAIRCWINRVHILGAFEEKWLRQNCRYIGYKRCSALNPRYNIFC